MHIDWTARMIASELELAAAPLFRKEFTVGADHGPVTRARLAISSRGVFEAWLNGHPVGDEVLSPGWTAYEWRLRYRIYDVTDLIHDTTVLAVLVGNGWHRGRLGFTGARAIYGTELGVIAQLEISYADGHVQRVATDDSWEVTGSDVLFDDLYDGQTIDARRRRQEWYVPFERTDDMFHVVPLYPTRAVDFDTSLLEPYIGPVVRRQDVIAPIEILTSPSGRTIVDFGQNLVGWVRFTVEGPSGSEIRIRHAEVLEHGELGTRPLRDAQATDRFILSGSTDAFEPTKTFHGFRYAEVSGWPRELGLDDLEAVVVHSDLTRTGWFDCSDPLLDQFHRNVVWGTKGNFLDVPTDCPQRNERLGWTGDIAAFTPSAAYLFDVEDFLVDWLRDLALEQAHADGRVAFVVPDVIKLLPRPEAFPVPETVAIWSDAAVWVPWALYQAYGELAVLERQFESMSAHVRRIDTLLSPSGLWDTGFQFGDWLDPDAPPDQPWSAKADTGVVATACLYRSASIVADTAALLGHADDASHFRSVADRTRTAFNAHYVDADGIVASDCTTVYTLAIVFGLLDEAKRSRAGDRLSELVRASGHRISTGFAGTPFILDALTMTGHLDEAYALLLQRACPSWLYPVTMGATTVWERWDSMLPDGTINPGEMTSFNHYALGAAADWMHRTIGGITPLEPGYRAVRIAPRPGPGLTWARTALESRSGRLGVEWRLEDDDLVVDVVVPEGVQAVLSLPGCEDEIAPAGRSTHRTGR